MSELVKLAENTFYIPDSTNIGVYRYKDNKVCVIDTGIDSDAGERIADAVEANGLSVGMIIVTHYHADHNGGCAALKRRTGAKVFTTPMGVAVIKNPLLNPSLIYGGEPIKKMKNRFYFIEATDAEPICDELLPKGLQIVPLSGHAFEMIGVKTDDGVFFVADSYVAKKDLENNPFTYVFDVAAYKESMTRVLKNEAKLYVPSHDAPTENVKDIIELNLQTVLNNASKIAAAINGAQTLEQIACKVIGAYSLNSITRHTLNLSIVRNYLCYMEKEGIITPFVQDGLLLFKRK